MQPKSRAQRVGIEINGVEYKGLNSASVLSRTKGEIQADYPGGQETLSDGQQKWAPLDIVWLDRADSDIAQFVHDIDKNNELVDLTYIEYDGHGAETRRWLIPDAECVKYENMPWNASGVEVAKINARFVFDEAILQS